MSWKERIEAAKAAGKFTEEDVRLSNVFTTCAIGERTGIGLDSVNCLDENGDKAANGFDFDSPSLFEDKYEADRLGMEFWHAVRNDDTDEASAIFDQIQELALDDDAVEEVKQRLGLDDGEARG